MILQHPLINILILNWNNKKILLDCIYSIKKSNYDNYIITVIDNGSKDDSINFIKSKFDDLNFIKINSNLGYAKGYNYAFENLKNNNFEWYLLLNNDTILLPESLSLLMAGVQNYKQDNIFGPKIKNYKNNRIWYAGGGRNIISGNFYHKGINSIEETIEYKAGITEFVSGCCMLVKKTVIEKLNGCNESYDMFYEDIDLCYRAKALGINCYYIPNSTIFHYISYSIGGQYSFTKLIKKLSSFIKFLYLNNSIYSFIYYILINIILSPLYIISFIYKKLSSYYAV